MTSFNGKESGVSHEIILLKKDKVIRDKNEVAKELHSYFNSTIREIEYIIEKNLTYSEPTCKAIMKFQFHPNILLLKEVK